MVKSLINPSVYGILRSWLERINADLIAGRPILKCFSARTNKVLVCKTAGYDEYYILPSIPRTDENDEEGIQVKENAKTGDLKRAFAKFSKSKTLNRQLLNKFIAQVA